MKRLALLPVVFGFGVAAACGGNDGNGTPDQPPPPPPPMMMPDDAGTVKLDSAAPPWCKDADGVYMAKRETGNALLLVDRSGSMQIKLTNGDTRWTATKKGISSLLSSLPPTTRAGAMMFPQGDKPITCCWIGTTTNDVQCSCANGALPGEFPRCDKKTYKAPVPVADLTMQQSADIMAYIATSDKEFYWGTPLAPSLQAAIDLQKASNLSGTKSVILLTDGYPTSCDTTQDPNANDIQRVIDAAATGLQGNTLVRTFVMGVIDGTKGAKASYLSPIASAGGSAKYKGCENTNDCFYALNANTFASDIKKAFDDIALKAFDCSFDLPPPEMGTTRDLSKVNVQLVSNNQTTQLSRDTNHQNGWDYLPNQTQIQLYGSSCQAVKDDPMSHVEIVVGCMTQGK